MKLRSWLLSVGVLCCAALVVGQAYGEDKKDEKKPEAKKEAAAPAPEKKADAPKDAKPAGGDKKPEAGGKPAGGPEMSAEEMAMMEAMGKAGTPGPAHDAFKPLLGSWTYTLKMRMTPTSQWMELAGTIERKAILGGHYFQEDVAGPAMGPGGPFQGIGMMGYDNTMKKYVGSWMDNMSTALQTYVGDFDAAKKTFTMTGEFADPTDGGKMKKSKTVMTIKDDKSHTVQMFMPGKDGKEFLSFDMNCTKK